MEKWSNSYIVGLKNFALRPTISLQLWTNSYNWARSNIQSKILSNNEDTLVVEIEAQIVRSTKTSKHAVAGPEVNADLHQFFESRKTELVSVTAKASTKKTAKRRRAVSKSQTETVKNTAKSPCIQAEIQLLGQAVEEPPNEQLAPAKKTPKRRRVVSKSQSETVKSTAKRPCIEAENQLSQTVEAKSPPNIEGFERINALFLNGQPQLLKKMFCMAAIVTVQHSALSTFANTLLVFLYV